MGLEYYARVSGYAAGLLDSTPCSPPLSADTRRAYNRYYARWQAGERFEASPRGTRVYAAAAVRWFVASDLRNAVGELEEALDEAIADDEDVDTDRCRLAADRVEELIAELMLSVPGRRGRRARDVTAAGAAA